MPGRTESLKGTGTCSSQLPGGALLVAIPGLACVDSPAAVIFAFSFLHPIAGSQGDSPGEHSETPPLLVYSELQSLSPPHSHSLPEV